MIEGDVTTNGVRLHYRDSGGDTAPLVLAHGLTANAHCFEPLAATLNGAVRLIAVDLRGRGASDQPAAGYSFADHAADLLGLLDALGLEQADVGGHSFGGLLGIYLAAHFPQRVRRLVLLDAAVGVTNLQTYELIKPAIDRLGQVYPSWPAYLAQMRGAAAYAGWWDPAIESYYRADIYELPDGTVTPRTHPATIAACVAASRAEPWPTLAAMVRCPTLLLRAAGAYGLPGAPPIVSDAQVNATLAAIDGCVYAAVPGNHMTMLYGAGAHQIAAALASWVHPDH